MRIVPVIVIAAMTTTACASTTPQQALQQQISRQWKNAEILPTSSATPCPSASVPGSQTTPLTADFNGDGNLDTALRVKTDEGQRLIVGIAEGNGYRLVDAGALDEAAAGDLSVRPRGVRYLRPDSSVDFYFGTDTLVATPCTGTPTAYIWLGESFTHERLAK